MAAPTTDPYAAYGGQSAPAATPPDPYAAYGGQSAPAAPTPQQPTTNFLAEQPGTVGMGALKRIKSMAAGLVDMTDAYLTGKVANTGVVPTLPVSLPEGGKVDSTLHTISNYLHQNTDAQGAAETAGGFIPDAIALANPALWAEEGTTEAMSLGDKALAMGRNLKTLEKNPGLLRMLQRTATSAAAGAGRAALPAAALTTVTGTREADPAKIGESALAAGALGATLDAIPAAASEVAAMVRPTSETLEGATIPVLASQRPNPPIATKLIRQAVDLPAVDAAQQAAPDVVIQNGAQRAIKNVLDQVNETRQVQGPAEATGTTPGTFKFSIDPINPQLEAEPLTIEQANTGRARLQATGSIGATVPQRIATGEPIPPPLTEAQARLQATGSQGAAIPERIAAGETPTTPFETTDPAIAQKMLTEAQRITENPNLGPRLRAKLEARIDDLNSQFDQFHEAQQSLPNFQPIDVKAAIDGTTDYRTAGDLMQRSVRDVYERMNTATDGEMSTLLQQPRWKSAQRMNELFDEHSNEFTPQEWRAASDAYRKGFVAKDLDNLLQKNFTVTRATAADTADIGGTRRFSGSNQTSKALDDLLQDHGDDLREMIGDQGIRSIRRMNQIMRDPETSGILAQTLDKIAMVMRRHGGPVAGFIGHSVAPILGISPHAGALGGAVGGEAMSYVINRMASDPAIADRLAYAATHKLSSSVVAPLIVTMMMRDSTPPPATPRPGGQK